MSFESTDFREMMPHTITVKTLASKNSDGSPVYSTSASTYRARVVQTSKQVRDMRGNVVMAAQLAYIASTAALSANSRFQLPAGTGGSTTPPVLRVDNFPDDDGVHHHRVWFGA